MEREEFDEVWRWALEELEMTEYCSKVYEKGGQKVDALDGKVIQKREWGFKEELLKEVRI